MKPAPASPNQGFFPIETHPPHSYKPIFKKIQVENVKKLNELCKRNPRTIIKFSLPGSSQKPTRKVSKVLKRAKLISNLGRNVKSRLNISKLQNHHHTTSLDIELPSLKTLSIAQRRQPISKVLISFKKLRSLALTFDRQIKMSQEVKFSLYYPLHCFRTLESLTVNYANSPGLPECLQKLSKLKSLRLNFHGSSINLQTLKYLASALKTLSLLQNFSLDLSSALSRNQNHNAQGFFASLTTLKFLKHFNLNLDHFEINGRADPESQGPLERWIIDCKTYFNEPALEKFILTLEILPSLKHLGLHFDSESRMTTGGFSKILSALKKLRFLSSFEARLPGTGDYSKPLKITGRTLKPLMNLTSLALEMNHERLTGFSEGLRSLVNLKKLNLIVNGDRDVFDKGVEGFKALGNCLKGLKSLKSLKLELWKMGMKTSEGLSSFWSGLGRLNKLTFLHLDLHGNDQLTKDNMESLGTALKRMPLLESVHFDFNGCKMIEGHIGPLIKVLDQLKMLEKVEFDASSLKFSEISKYFEDF